MVKRLGLKPESKAMSPDDGLRRPLSRRQVYSDLTKPSPTTHGTAAISISRPLTTVDSPTSSSENHERNPVGSVLRMNTDFRILPAVVYPAGSSQVMDAGMSGQYRMKTSLRSIAPFANGTGENTSGVIFVDIRDLYRSVPSQPQKILHREYHDAARHIYSNLLTIRDYNRMSRMEYAKAWLTSPFSFIVTEPATKEQEIWAV